MPLILSPGGGAAAVAAVSVGAVLSALDTDYIKIWTHQAMQGKTGSRPRGPSIGGENMTTLFTDDPLMHGLALFGNGGQLGLLSHTPPNFTPGSYEVNKKGATKQSPIDVILR